MKIYPYSAPLILNDEVFSEYGGKELSSTPEPLRQAAYLWAEQKMTSYLDAFLLPTIVTGTAYWFEGVGFVSTDWGYVNRLLWVRVLDHNDNELRLISGTYSWAAIREDTYGYIYIQDCLQECQCPLNQPYKFQFAYESGLPTGTASQPGVLAGLVAASQIFLNEMEPIPANESTGDAGITEYSSLQYSEKRKPWKNTVFGSSPKAAWIAKLVDGTIKKARKAVMLGRL